MERNIDYIFLSTAPSHYDSARFEFVFKIGIIMSKHTWTLQEEEICCREVILEYVAPRTTPSRSTKDFIAYLQTKLPQIESGSIRMKIQNIKTILEETNIPNRLEISRLDNYSLLNLEAFNRILLELGR